MFYEMVWVSLNVSDEAKFSPSHCKSQQLPRDDSGNSTLRCRVKMNPAPTDWKWTTETWDTLGRTDNKSQTVKPSEFWAFQQVLNIHNTLIGYHMTVCKDNIVWI